MTSSGIVTASANEAAVAAHIYFCNASGSVVNGENADDTVEAVTVVECRVEELPRGGTAPPNHEREVEERERSERRVSGLTIGYVYAYAFLSLMHTFPLFSFSSYLCVRAPFSLVD